MKPGEYQKQLIQHFVEKNNAIVEEYYERTFVTYTKGLYPCLMAFRGKRKSPYLHYKFVSFTDYSAELLQQKKNAEEDYEWKEKQKADKEAAANKLKVGDILYTSWGYEQTNVEFYQVIEKPSKWYVVVQEIRRDMSYSDGLSPMAGYAMPIKGEFIGEPLKRKITTGGCINIHRSASASLWDGSKKYVSWYA